MSEPATRIRVAVSGAAGRMGASTCAAVERQEDLELVCRCDPAINISLAEALATEPDVLVDFSVPDAALETIAQATRAGIDVVVGTTGFDLERIEPHGSHVFVAPNFAIGAVLMMRFAAQAARHMRAAEIIELHHDQKLDRPSGTAALTARLIAEQTPGAPQPPIHSVRLPGLLAHQEVILGDVGQTLTIRHDSIDRESFMPGVLLAIRRVGTQADPVVVGLEHFLD
jgi:4-hydroxy-tetrahydrodipicolinate reductase